MSFLVKLLIVAAGGAAGTVCRYLLEARFHSALVTATINIVSSFLMGIFAGWVVASAMDADKRLLISLMLMTGFCGGLSTFAHFTIITVNYFRSGDTISALGYIFLTVVLGLACCFAGFLIGTRIPSA